MSKTESLLRQQVERLENLVDTLRESKRDLLKLIASQQESVTNEGELRLSFAEIKESILNSMAIPKYKQASIVMLENIFLQNTNKDESSKNM